MQKIHCQLSLSLSLTHACTHTHTHAHTYTHEHTRTQTHAHQLTIWFGWLTRNYFGAFTSFSIDRKRWKNWWMSGKKDRREKNAKSWFTHEKLTTIFFCLILGGARVVRVLALYADNLSSNPAGYYKFVFY